MWTHNSAFPGLFAQFLFCLGSTNYLFGWLHLILKNLWHGCPELLYLQSCWCVSSYGSIEG